MVSEVNKKGVKGEQMRGSEADGATLWRHGLTLQNSRDTHEK